MPIHIDRVQHRDGDPPLARERWRRSVTAATKMLGALRGRSALREQTPADRARDRPRRAQSDQTEARHAVTGDAEAARPGRTYFAPGVRVMRLGTAAPGPRSRARRSRRSSRTSSASSVTRVNHGASQYCITLNNWYDALPADRADARKTRSPGASGPSVVSRCGRGSSTTTSRSSTSASGCASTCATSPISIRDRGPRSHRCKIARQWVPMIAGPISDMRFTFSESEGARADRSAARTTCAASRRRTPARSTIGLVPEKEVIEDVLRRAGFPLPDRQAALPAARLHRERGQGDGRGPLRGTELPRVPDALRRSHGPRGVHRVRRASTTPGSGVEFHIECARSRVPGRARRFATSTSSSAAATWSSSIPDLRVVDQYTSVTVTGRNRVSSSPTCVSGRAPPSPTGPGPTRRRTASRRRAGGSRRSCRGRGGGHGEVRPQRPRGLQPARLRRGARLRSWPMRSTASERASSCGSTR